ncbi:hypothetical protein GCM10022221_80080 [Actinocorallia aurea]
MPTGQSPANGLNSISCMRRHSRGDHVCETVTCSQAHPPTATPENYFPRESPFRPDRSAALGVQRPVFGARGQVSGEKAQGLEAFGTASSCVFYSAFQARCPNGSDRCGEAQRR